MIKVLDKNELILQELVTKIKENEAGIESFGIGLNYESIINFIDGTKVVFDLEDLCKIAADFKEKEESEVEEWEYLVYKMKNLKKCRWV